MENKYTKKCFCCYEEYKSNDEKSYCCEFCSKIHKEMILKLNKRKKDESAVEYKIRFLLFEKIRILNEVINQFECQDNCKTLKSVVLPEIILSHSFYLLIFYFELSEYNHCIQLNEEIKKVDLIETFNEVLKCYYENRENDLPLCLEKFKTHVLKSNYSVAVQIKLKDMRKNSYSVMCKFCLDCGEEVEEYMKDRYCQACTMIDQAIGDE